jgi:choline dehydrogenase-like flavoprotein
MQIEDLHNIAPAGEVDADLVIVGGGPAGLTIAREFLGSQTQVILLESGTLEETSLYAALNAVESVADTLVAAQIEKRHAFHGANARFWSHELQPYGVRCRVLGGASAAWVGKCAPFDALDFEARPWVSFSGWPIARADLDNYLDRAAARLNLGPNVNDDRF